MDDTTKVFLPYRGEFGFICMFHAPQVHAAVGPKVVVIERGLEPLYPGCDYLYIKRRKDSERRARVEKSFMMSTAENIGHQLDVKHGKENWHFVEPNQEAPRKYFVPQNEYHNKMLPENIDVVVCPRKREYGPDKNWKHWQDLVDCLRSQGLIVVAVGHPESSFFLKGIVSVWDYAGSDRYLDHTIEAMSKARLVVSTDNGLAHLAVMCGKPLLMISHGKGLVAEGEDDVGNSYWPIHLDRFERENHTGSEIHVINHAWHSFTRVSDHVRSFLGVCL